MEVTPKHLELVAAVQTAIRAGTQCIVTYLGPRGCGKTAALVQAAVAIRPIIVTVFTAGPRRDADELCDVIHRAGGDTNRVIVTRRIEGELEKQYHTETRMGDAADVLFIDDADRVPGEVIAPLLRLAHKVVVLTMFGSVERVETSDRDAM